MVPHGALGGGGIAGGDGFPNLEMFLEGLARDLGAEAGAENVDVNVQAVQRVRDQAIAGFFSNERVKLGVEPRERLDRFRRGCDNFCQARGAPG